MRLRLRIQEPVKYVCVFLNTNPSNLFPQVRVQLAHRKVTKMKKLISRSALLLSCSLCAIPAQAQYWYMGVKGGMIFPYETRFNQNPGSSTLFTTDEKRGYSVGGQLGYDMGMLRIETDVYYQRTNLEKLTNNGYTALTNVGQVDATGSHQSYNFMLNLLFDVINTDRFTFSIGGGAGGINTKLKDYQPAGQAAFLTGDEWHIGYQGIAGARFAMSDKIDLTLDYRYAQSGKAKFVDRFGTGTETKFKSHAALIGISFKFGNEKAPDPTPVPEPVQTMAEPMPAPVQTVAPPAPPMPAQPGPYLVFFDWDKANVTAEAQTILRSALASFRETGQATISVSGYADRSGDSSYNDGLSMKRANAVKQFLLQSGLAADVISVESFGESNPLVATDDGVREPQNRRVELKLSQNR
jgi:OmpA-OmpF porin, OOP family